MGHARRGGPARQRSGSAAAGADRLGAVAAGLARGRGAPEGAVGGATVRQRCQLPPTMAHFAHVNRYWDRVHGIRAAKLLPGEYYVSTSGEMIVTVLGSCVSACVRDVRLGVGGMNHFMLPLDVSQGNSAWRTAVSAATRYGNVAMERLINDILKLGGQRESLEFKLVGGGKVLRTMSMDIGLRNIS